MTSLHRVTFYKSYPVAIYTNIKDTNGNGVHKALTSQINRERLAEKD